MTQEGEVALRVAVLVTVALALSVAGFIHKPSWLLAVSVACFSLATAVTWARAARLRGWFGGR